VESDHIIKYYTSIYDTSESALNLVMELCAGSLRTQLPHRTYSKEELLSFTAQIDAAFLELLEKKLMHLDLKPENILIAAHSDNCYKICDFGCAQIAIQSKLTKYDNQTFGTFNYLAPENYLNYHGKLTNTSADIWSLGVILYEMMYKRLPLPVDTDGFIDRKAMQHYF
jgi:serine/threonine protein kinase